MNRLLNALEKNGIPQDAIERVKLTSKGKNPYLVDKFGDKLDTHPDVVAEKTKGGTGSHVVGNTTSISHDMGMEAHEIEESAAHSRFGGKLKGFAGLAVGAVAAGFSGFAAASEKEGTLAEKTTAGVNAAGEVAKNVTPVVNSAVALERGNPPEAIALAVDNIPVVGDVNRLGQRAFALATGRPTSVEPSMFESASNVLANDAKYLAAKGNEAIGKLQDGINSTVKDALGKNEPVVPKSISIDDLPPTPERLAMKNAMAAVKNCSVAGVLCTDKNANFNTVQVLQTQAVGQGAVQVTQRS